jgi:hypothetical protein
MTYIATIFCLTSEYHKQIPSELINLGYEVSSSFDDGKCFFVKNIVTIIIYKLRTEDDKKCIDVTRDIKIAINNIKGYCYGIVVNKGQSHSAFGNIDGATDPTRILQLKALW